MPDDASRIARLEQRVSDLQANFDIIVRAEVAELKSDLRHVGTDLTKLDLRVSNVVGSLEERAKVDQEERRATRRAMYAVLATLGAAVIAGVFGVIAALVGAFS